MKEKDYNKWLESKSEIEHFDEIPEVIKKGIYNAEQELEGNEEVELEEIFLEDQVILFSWIGIDEEYERVAKEMGTENLDDADEMVSRAGHEMMKEVLSNYNELSFSYVSPTDDFWEFTTFY